MSEQRRDAPKGGFAGKLWLAYAVITILCSLAALAIYVNTYDDYDVSERLRATGLFMRRAMSVLSFPLGFVFALTDEPLQRAFGCEGAEAPCSLFVAWHTRFAAVLAQIALLRWLVARRTSAR